MYARNAQLEIENESLKNELQNSRADYTALQVDMNDVRDYYHQIDIAASKMGHRCEVRRPIQDFLYCESWWGLFVMIRLFARGVNLLLAAQGRAHIRDGAFIRSGTFLYAHEHLNVIQYSKNPCEGGVTRA